MSLSDKPILTVLRATAVIYAIYLPIALWLGHTYVPLPAPPGASPLYGISHTKGYAFSSPLAYSFRPFADDKLDDQGSPVMLYEDNKPLGPAHSDDLDIERIGKGRYSYRKGVGLIFSTSDNSDPAANGRHYWVDCPNKSPLTSELRCDP
ncbi:hypothetical protein SAMN05444158_1533 [Bradyrhizobium canariense]|uniref:Uncharacterized protein n=2 Tax=Bradyrhizobium canariense TaxID=255045 RepID=A0A1H1QTZ3_9BRAD|nr:hypothetical protein SAMN05444158_1533 [Bradyrhizobium canariense]